MANFGKKIPTKIILRKSAWFKGRAMSVEAMDEEELAVCKKWAALANIALPCKGDRYVIKTNRQMFYDDKFRTPIGVLREGSITGEVTDYSYYVSTTTDAWDPPSGICIEYQLPDAMGISRTVFVQITCNADAYVELYQTSDKLTGIWDEDKRPDELPYLSRWRQLKRPRLLMSRANAFIGMNLSIVLLDP